MSYARVEVASFTLLDMYALMLRLKPQCFVQGMNQWQDDSVSPYITSIHSKID